MPFHPTNSSAHCHSQANRPPPPGTPRGAGTDGGVWVELQGRKGSSGAIRWPGGPGHFKQGGKDVVQVGAPTHLGDLLRLDYWRLD